MARLTRITGGTAGAVLSATLIMGCSSTETEGQNATQDGTTAAMSEETAPGAAEGEGITVTSADEREPAPGDDEYFTGDTTVDELFGENDSSRASAGSVSFEPGARTAWHTHPAGQQLIITEGTGWVQEEGQERITVSEGDVVWFAPGVRHWHGATATDPMTHIAIQDTVDGASVEWLEHVEDDDYDSDRES
ncbi:(R)-mandelonitrile lyase [Corynebacterium glyciniphilum]|uniref:(R)-mandelonitrile lyase n=1 Tax=Corynebacterium glyciniphilum TaxID=1404244 RepID=UPI003DA02DC0